MSPRPERRRDDRLSVYLAAEVFVDETKTRTAITKDVGAQGALVLTRNKLTVGQAVRLRVYLPGEDDRVLVVSGKVLRHETLSVDERGTWRNKVALEFDEPQGQLAEEFASLAAEQARLFHQS